MLKKNHLLILLLAMFFGILACKKEKKETTSDTKKTDSSSNTCSQTTFDSLKTIGNSKNLSYKSDWAKIYLYDSTNVMEKKIWEAYASNCNSCIEKLLNENNTFSKELPAINDLEDNIRTILKYKTNSKYPKLNSKKVKYNLNFENFKTWDALSNFTDTTIYSIYKEDNISPYQISNTLYSSLIKFTGNYKPNCQIGNNSNCKNDSLIIEYVKQRANFIVKTFSIDYEQDCPENIIDEPFWAGTNYFSFNKTLDSVYFQNVSDYVTDSKLYVKINSKWYLESELETENK